ncbi:MAG TPA: tetratricopeptide repeat protein [Vicinamibacterales bacterium]
MASLSEIQALLTQDRATTDNLALLEEQLGTRAGIVPFVGAGLSAPFGFPQWGDFLLKLASEAGTTDAVKARLKALEYEEAAGDLMTALGTRRFQDLLAANFGDQRLDGKPIGGAVAELAKLPPGPLITTNFDRVIETAFTQAKQKLTPWWHSYGDRGTEALQQDKAFLLKLHGDWDDPTTRVLTLDEYRTAYGADDALNIRFDLPVPTLLFKLLTGRCCVFLGCSLKQDRTMQLLHAVAKDIPHLVHYAIVERPADDAGFHRRAAELSNQSIRPIWYPPTHHEAIQPLLAYLGDRAWDGLRKLAAGAPARTPAAAQIPDNLPVLTDKTIGRDLEISQVRDMTRAAHLITISGPGGCGKSRLAIEVARAIKDQFEKGVWFIPLSDLARSADEERVLTTRIARIVGIAEQPRPPLESLAEYFNAGRFLLVLDNCEHLAASCAEVLGYLLPHCPDLTVIATSRAPLKLLQWERFYPLAPLEVPDEELRDPKAIGENESVQLFIERARRRDPNWTLRPEQALAVAQLCRALEGIPLAIEVAAARLGVKSIEAMREQSEDLLTALGNKPTGDLRTWTLSEALRWSYRLLDPAHQRTMRLMTVFDGGWTEEAAQAIVGPETPDPVIDQLQELQDQSLVVTKSEGDTTRFRYLEPIRQVVEKELTPDEHRQTDQRHADFFLRFVETAAPHLLQADQAAWLDRLQADVDNLRRAIRWSVSTGNVEYGLRLMAALWRFAEIRGFLREGRDRCEAVMQMSGAGNVPALYSKVLSGAGMLAYRQADYAAAEKHFSESLRIETSLGNQLGIANACNDLGNVANMRGRFEQARELYGKALAIQEQGNDERAVSVTQFNLGVVTMNIGRFDDAETLLKESLAGFRKRGNTRESAFPLNGLGQLHASTGDTVTARAYAAESLDIRQKLRDMKGAGDSHRTLAWIAAEEPDFPDARTHLIESLTLANGVGDPRGLTETLEVMGFVYARIGRAAEAVEALTAAEHQRSTLGYPLPPIRVQRRDAARAAAAALLDPAALARAEAAGRGLRFPDALESLLTRLKSETFV